MATELSRPPLTIRFRASALLYCWLFILHGLALAAVMHSALPVSVSLLLSAGLLYSAVGHWHAWVKPGALRPIVLRFWPDGDGELVTAERSLAVRWVPGGYRMAGVQLLYVSMVDDGDRRLGVLILPDMASFEDRCRLRGFVSRFEADQRNILG